MKKVFLLTVLMVMMFTPTALAKEVPIEVFINYVELELEGDQSAVLNKELGRTYLPLRAVAEYLGAEVGWKPEGVKGKNVPEVHIRKDGRLIIVPIGLKTAWVNDKQVEIEAPAYVEKATNRAMVPLRFVSEALGTEVRWESEYRVVYITDPDKPMGMCARDYLEKGNPLNNFAKADIEWYETGRCSLTPIVIQGYPPYATPNGTVWVKNAKFDGRYLTYTERVNRFGVGVEVRFFDEYGNMFIPDRSYSGYKREGVWGTWDNVKPCEELFPLKGEVTEIQFHGIGDGYGITWVYEVRD